MGEIGVWGIGRIAQGWESDVLGLLQFMSEGHCSSSQQVLTSCLQLELSVYHFQNEQFKLKAKLKKT